MAPPNERPTMFKIFAIALVASALAIVAGCGSGGNYAQAVSDDQVISDAQAELVDERSVALDAIETIYLRTNDFESCYGNCAMEFEAIGDATGEFALALPPRCLSVASDAYYDAIKNWSYAFVYVQNGVVGADTGIQSIRNLMVQENMLVEDCLG
jgi:hypothetical protein